MGDAAEQHEDHNMADALRAASAKRADNDVPLKVELEFLNIEEAAVLLRVSENTLREVLRTGAFPWAKPIGKQVRISRTALLEWFKTESSPATKKRRAL